MNKRVSIRESWLCSGALNACYRGIEFKGALREWGGGKKTAESSRKRTKFKHSVKGESRPRREHTSLEIYRLSKEEKGLSLQRTVLKKPLSRYRGSQPPP